MKKGFTLAEVLITLVMIGVVSALTIPSLINNVSDQQNRIAWKKAFGDLSQAGQRLAFDNGGDLSGMFGTDIANDNIMRDYLASYMNYTKKCDSGRNVIDGCWHDQTKFYKLSGQAHVDYSQNAGLILNNGTLVTISYQSTGCNHSYAANDDTCGGVVVDINGYHGPNTIGKDIYGIYLLRNGAMVPFGTQGDDWSLTPADYGCDLTDNWTEGWNCSALYLYQ